jgi:hypothetical protein
LPQVGEADDEELAQGREAERDRIGRDPGARRLPLLQIELLLEQPLHGGLS